MRQKHVKVQCRMPAVSDYARNCRLVVIRLGTYLSRVAAVVLDSETPGFRGTTKDGRHSFGLDASFPKERLCPQFFVPHRLHVASHRRRGASWKATNILVPTKSQY